MRRIGQIFSFLIPVIALAIFMSGCARQEARKTEEFKAKLRRVDEEAWNKGNLDALDEIFATDFVRHQPPNPDMVGLEAYKQYISDARKAFPDSKLTFDEIIIEGETGATRYSWKGTHTGESEILPIPSTGKEVANTGVTMFNLVDGKIAEDWSYGDWLGLYQQLGFKIIPPEEQSGK